MQGIQIHMTAVECVQTLYEHQSLHQCIPPGLSNMSSMARCKAGVQGMLLSSMDASQQQCVPAPV